jgi:Relaxase/Mobilisation nuclease domain
MIINGGSRRNARFFAQHLSKAEEHEHVTLCEIRNLAARGIADALREMEAIAIGSQCENFFYHANINPLHSEELTAEQWRTTANTLEKNLGLSGHARFIVEHRKKGRTHRHVIWLRIDVSTMRAVRMTDDYEKHQATARQMETEFGLRAVPSVLGTARPDGSRPSRRARPWETFRGHSSGIDPYAMKKEITALYLESIDASAFAARLAASGYGLVRGNRHGFCVVDKAGHLHSLPRRIHGTDAATLAAFLEKSVSPNPAFLA